MLIFEGMYNQQQTASRFLKTRIAPTPSGYLHLGNIMSFALTAALAQKSGAQILLRIDDLDQARANEKYIQDIFDTLDFLGIAWDEGPRDIDDFHRNWSQIHRMEIYQEALKQLRNNNKVFACNCTRTSIRQLGGTDVYPGTCITANIKFDAANCNWRLYTHDCNIIQVCTLTNEIVNTALPADMKNFVVRKKDSHPAYQLASVIDDLYFGVDLIVRGQDLWPSTLAQHCLAGALGQHLFNNITFHHHALLIDPEGQKLSKSAGSTSIKYLRDSGYNALQIYNLIAQSTGLAEQVTNCFELGNAIYSKTGVEEGLWINRIK